MNPVLISVGVIAGFVLLQAVRHPVQRRLALRDAARRPTETMLVIAGSLLGTALITGSFIVGDTLDSSIRSSAYTQLGPVDEVIQVPDAQSARRLQAFVEDPDPKELERFVREQLSELRRSTRKKGSGDPFLGREGTGTMVFGTGLGDPRDLPGLLDGVVTITSVPAATTTIGEARKSEPGAQLLELDFEAAADFGGDPTITGIEGSTPGVGEAVITDDLAAKLGIEAGESFKAFVYAESVELTVDRVLPQKGLAGFWRGFESTSPNVFVAPGTIAELARRVPGDAIPPQSLVLLSNRGGVEEGAALTTQVENSLAGLRVDPIKSDLLSAAEREGENFQELFLGIGAFAIIAGILLLVNIFVMLADERKSQLGMLRAVGMRRIDLIRAFVIEGTVYAIAASILGAVVGIGVGWAIVKLAAPIFGGFEDFGLDLVFSMENRSLTEGFAIGLVISFLTILLTSFRISRINIIAAIRDLPMERIRITRGRNIVIGSLISVAGVTWFVIGLGDPSQWPGAQLGLPLAFYFSLPVTSRFIDRRTAIVIASALSLAWGIFGNSITGGQFYAGGDIFAFVVVGILLTFAAVVLLSQVGDVFERIFARFGARRLSLRLGMSYPLAQRFRTGLTLGMYALVIFTMTFIAVLTEVFGGQVDRVVEAAAGDYDMIVTANRASPPEPDVIEGVEGVEEVTSFLQGTALYEAPGVAELQPWGAVGIDRSFVESGPPKLEEREDTYSSDAAVWEAVVEDPSLVVVPDFFLQVGGGPPSDLIGPGATVISRDPATGKTVERRIAGVLNQDLTFSVYMSERSIKQVLGRNVARSLFFVKADGGEVEARSTATRMQDQLFRNGVEADTFRALVEEFQGANLQFLRLMQAYLALGLVVGIAGLGVVMVRSVRERRREIGVLRAIGFVAPQVRRAFLSESGFTALQGIVVGTVLALVTAAQLVNSGEFGATAVFAIPWGDIAILTGAALVASLLATAWPAHQASRIPPAVALRTAE